MEFESLHDSYMGLKTNIICHSIRNQSETSLHNCQSKNPILSDSLALFCEISIFNQNIVRKQPSNRTSV